jgi:hypothetical protein
LSADCFVWQVLTSMRPLPCAYYTYLTAPTRC